MTNSSLHRSSKRNFGIEFEGLTNIGNVGDTAKWLAEVVDHELLSIARYENWNGTRNHEYVDGRWVTADKKDQWRVCPDGSLDGTASHPYGVEIITPLPSDCENGFKTYDSIYAVCEKLNEGNHFMVNKECGTHVTLETIDEHGRAMTADDIKRFMKLWLVFENTMDTIVSRSRRDGHYCGHLGKAYLRRGNTMADAFARIDENTVQDEVESFWRRNGDATSTFFYAPSANLQKVMENRIEFRQHQGTLNANKIIRYMELCEMFLTASQNGVEIQPTAWNHTPSIQDMISMLNGEAVEYFYTNADGSTRRHTTWNSNQSGHYTRQGNGVQGSERSMRGDLWFHYDALAQARGLVPDQCRRSVAVEFANSAVDQNIAEYFYAIQQVTRWRNHRIANPITVPASQEGIADMVDYFNRRAHVLQWRA